MKLECKKTGTIMERDIDNTPGPAAYKTENYRLHEQPKISMSFRFPTRIKETMPAPNAYYPKPERTEKSDPAFSMKMRNNQNFISQAVRRSGKASAGDINLRPQSALCIGKQQSFSFRFKHEPIEKLPGPSNYHVEKGYKACEKTDPSFTIKACKTEAYMEAKKKKDGPAPNSYRCDKDDLTKYGAGHFPHNFTRFKPMKSDTPGPGAYSGDFKKIKKRPQSASFSYRYSKVWTF